MVAVDVSELGVGVLAEHQRRLHESGARRLTGQAKVEQRAIVHKVVLGVSTDAAVQFLLVRQHCVGRGIVAGLHVRPIERIHLTLLELASVRALFPLDGLFLPLLASALSDFFSD